MKNTLYIAFLFITFTTVINAQENIIPLENKFDNDSNHNDYFKDVNNILNKYLGTWEYSNGPHYFKITFFKTEHIDELDLGPGMENSIKIYSDFLQSEFIYKLNGVTIYDTYVDNNLDDDVLISGSFINSTNEISLYYKEPTTACRRNKNGSLSLSYESAGFTTATETLTWTRTSNTPHGWNLKCPDGTDIDNSDFVIPENMSLNKI